MENISETIYQVEETRSRLHVLLTDDIYINSHEPLTVSKELDDIINQYYEENRAKSLENTCMICSSRMHRKSG